MSKSLGVSGLKKDLDFMCIWLESFILIYTRKVSDIDLDGELDWEFWKSIL